MKKLFLATLLSTAFAYVQANNVVLHTKFIATSEQGTFEKEETVTLDENNKGSLTVPEHIVIEFTAVVQEDAQVLVECTIKKDDAIVAEPSLLMAWGKKASMACTSCPCERNDVDYTLEITAEQQ